MKVAIVHLDLGQGGAERQTIDEAIALKSNGHDVTIFTSHHDPKRAFDETTDKNILGNNIQVYGDWIPRHLCGRFHALMSIYRMLWCSLRLLCSPINYDVIFVDQVAAAIPFLKLRSSKVVYYCHHPDLLLVQNKHKSSYLKQLYRIIIDWFETITTANCNELLVNSKYTKRVVLTTFSDLKQMPYLQPKVVYPAIDTKQFQSIYQHNVNDNKRITFLSINRYERKKQIEIAIKALYKLLQICKENERNDIKLIIAGGYDDRVIENKEYLDELIDACQKMKLKYQFIEPQMNIDENALFLDDKGVDECASIYFVTKFPDKQKEELLIECSAVLYTPRNEHFGIVPIEAMLGMRPVIASESGGPLETVIDGQTGFLCGDNVDEWVDAMKRFVDDRGLTMKMGALGKQRVIDCFSRKQLQNVMESVVQDVMGKKVRLDLWLVIQTWFIIIVIGLSFFVLTPIFIAVNALSMLFI